MFSKHIWNMTHGVDARKTDSCSILETKASHAVNGP